MEKMDKINQLATELLELCSNEEVAAAIIISDKEKNGNGVYMVGSPLDQALQAQSFESAIEDVHNVPIEVLKMLAAESDGDPSKICQCPKCSAKRAAEQENDGEEASADEVSQIIKSIFGVD